MLSSKIVGSENTDKKLINHIIFLIDASGSMSHRLPLVKHVFDSTLKSFREMGGDQTINLSVYDFDQNVRKIVFNESISTMNKTIPFRAGGTTALRDAIKVSIDDHKNIKQR